MIKFKDSQKGISLYLALLILSLNLSIVLGITIILINEMKRTQKLGYSVVAFYAADTGIEEAIDDRDNHPTSYSGSFNLSGNVASYEVSVTDMGGGNFSIKSVGSYEGTKRAISATY
ncbi:hypothetical protein KAR26_03365 [Candidatus Parcubacteria bacterium]|nr:hypothetical protein [Candidatus Parcubacteria bacterium]